MNLNLNLTHLQNFIQIVEWGNISKAASVLNIAQPALSRQIKALEDSFGASLLQRHTWGVEPTEAGKLVLEHARRIQKECISAKESVQSNQDNPTGTVYLGIPAAYAVSLVPPLLQGMRVKYPNIKVHIVEAFSGTIYEWLVTGRLDLALLYYSREHDAAATTPYLDEDMVALRRPNAFESDSTVTLEELAGKQLIVPWRPHMFRLALETAFFSQGIPFEPHIEIDSMPCMKELARRGEGTTILPPSTVTSELELGLLSQAQVTPRLNLRTVLGQPMGRKPTRAVSLAIEELERLAIELAPETGWNVATELASKGSAQQPKAPRRLG